MVYKITFTYITNDYVYTYTKEQLRWVTVYLLILYAFCIGLLAEAGNDALVFRYRQIIHYEVFTNEFSIISLK